ncbi:MAG: LysR family transcriptional regulator [Rhodoferax sp.]|uniref:LysR family transcriptional regulator n=1 Tax=Rhodoferax sp. TaxID=50421 RepID=UPI002730F7DD|nr:LysR family transcriptional regulator [Rhodoferax sp.]MDP1531178.1 LysR family transcriptional regulator [Rhodoferax sp.]MDP1942228.1 LysR family transcriptional regulator [Rhodoferax sp.]
MKDLTLRQLRVFEAVATQRSYSRAADQMGLSQPAVSIQMQQLENEVGVPLLVKIGRRVSLTQAGEEMLQQSRRVINQMRVAQEAVTAFRVTEGATGGILHLGVIPVAHYFAPALMMAFAQRWPGVKFKLTVDGRTKILAMLADYQLDIAIGGYPPSEADVDAETFARQPHCIVASPDHPLAGQRDIPWSALRNEQFIFRESGSATRQFFEKILQAQSMQVQVFMELSGNETIKQAVMAGMGISLLSAHTFQTELLGGQLVVLDVGGMPKMLDWCFLHRRGSLLSGTNEAFRQLVLTRGAELAKCHISKVL